MKKVSIKNVFSLLGIILVVVPGLSLLCGMMYAVLTQAAGIAFKDWLIAGSLLGSLVLLVTWGVWSVRYAFIMLEKRSERR